MTDAEKSLATRILTARSRLMAKGFLPHRVTITEAMGYGRFAGMEVVPGPENEVIAYQRPHRSLEVVGFMRESF